MNQGKMTLREVGSKSKSLDFSQSDEWVQQALQKAAPHEDLVGMGARQWASDSKISGSLTLERLDPEYTLIGSFEARVPLLCPRCGEAGSVARQGSFQLVLRPLGNREVVEESDDPDYILLETPYVDLVEILSEQVVAAEGVIEHPDQESSGKPHECPQSEEINGLRAENNLSSGQKDSNEGKSPFAVLGQLKNLKKG